MIIHTAPYTNLTVALFALAILVKWFGENVAWVNLGIPKILIYVNRMMIVFQVISTATKIFQVRYTKLASGLFKEYTCQNF